MRKCKFWYMSGVHCYDTINLNRLRVYIFLADVCKEKVWGSILITCYTHTSRTFISCGSSRFFFFGGARFSSFLQLQFYVSTNIIHETDRKLHPFYHKINIRIPKLLTGEVRNFVILFVLLEIKFGRLAKMKRKKLNFMEQDTAFITIAETSKLVKILDSAAVYFHSYSHVCIIIQRISLAFSCLFLKHLKRQARDHYYF